MNAHELTTTVKSLIEAVQMAKLAIQEAEGVLDKMDAEEIATLTQGGTPEEARTPIKLNKRGQRLVELLQRPGGAHIDYIADELCVERESVRSLISKTSRRLGKRATCHNGYYQLA